MGLTFNIGSYGGKRELELVKSDFQVSGFRRNSSYTSVTPTLNSSKFELSYGIQWNEATSGGIITINTIDLSKYTTLSVNYDLTATGSNSAYIVIFVCNTTLPQYLIDISNQTPSVSIKDTTISNQILTTTIGNNFTTAKVGIALCLTGQNTGSTLTINKIWAS